MIEKNRQLLAQVAVYSPHLAGTVLRLHNDLEDAARLGELPPPELLHQLGLHLRGVGEFVAGAARAMQVEYHSEPVVIPNGE